MHRLTKFVPFLFLALAGCANGGNQPNLHEYNVSVNDPDVIPGEILVDLKDNVSDEDIKELSAIAETKLYERNSVAHQYRYEYGAVDAKQEDAILERLRQDPRVEFAEPMTEYHALFVPNDPLYEKDQWHMKRVGLESSLNMSCGMGVTVAVVDTGIDCNLSDLSETKCSGGYNFISNNEDATDDQGHGSHCAGTIAQATNNGIGGAGLAPCVKLMPVKVLNAMGGGTSESVASGIQYAADNGANVISLSLGSHMPSSVIESAVNHARSKGVVVVAANGNSGRSVGWPAAFEGVIAVSAIDVNDNIAYFSSRGPETAIAAPGVSVMQQTIGGEDGKGEFKKLNGTSMACPHVSGAAALVMASGITDPDSVRSKLQSTADPKNDRNLFGAGILRADSAVRSTYLWHTLFRLLGLFGLLFALRKTVSTDVLKKPLTLIGLTVFGFGVLPLLFFGLPQMGSLRFLGEALVKPVGEWSLLLGLHKYLPFANFVLPGLAMLLMMGHKHLKYLAGGIALGMGALCAQMAFSGDVAFFLGGLVGKLWLVANTVACAWLAKTSFVGRK